MPKTKTVASLPGFVEPDMDDELDNATPVAFPTPDSNQENDAVPAKKSRPKTKAAGAKFTKTKAPARRVSGGAAVVKKKAAPRKKAAGKREPLKEQTNIQHGSDTEDVEEFEGQNNESGDPIEDPSEAEERVVKKQPATRKPAARGKKKTEVETDRVETESETQSKIIEKDGEFEYTPTINRQSKVNAKPAKAEQKKAGRPRAPKEIPETQTESMDLDPSSLPADDDAIPQSVYRQTSNFRATSKTQQPSVIRKRAGSASDTERTGNDPTIRRKLGDLSKKFDNLEMKYSNLREVGIEEAKTNFERLKVQSEAKTKGTFHHQKVPRKH